MADIDTLERELLDDLRGLGARLRDDDFTRELYGALTNRVWRKPGGPDGHVSFSWKRADEMLAGLRDARGAEPLTLAQTGGEGELSPAAADVLGGLGWTSQPLDTGHNDPAHDTSTPDAPPADQGARARGVDPGAEEREAHAAAERERLRVQPDAPPQTETGAG